MAAGAIANLNSLASFVSPMLAAYSASKAATHSLTQFTRTVRRRGLFESFADVTTADLWAERNIKAARRIPRELWHIVHRKLTMLDSAQRLEDLAAMPGNRFEALAGDRKGHHSIRVNQQYRVTFKWESNDAYDVRCEDYH
jgi:toxin HigB-1